MKINELIQDFEVWTTNEEKELLKKLHTPIKISNLEEHDQFRVEALVRKSLVTKIGQVDPTVVINDQNK